MAILRNYRENTRPMCQLNGIGKAAQALVRRNPLAGSVAMKWSIIHRDGPNHRCQDIHTSAWLPHTLSCLRISQTAPNRSDIEDSDARTSAIPHFPRVEAAFCLVPMRLDKTDIPWSANHSPSTCSLSLPAGHEEELGPATKIAGLNEGDDKGKRYYPPYTSQTRKPSASDVSGSRAGINSCPTYPSYPVSTIARMIAG